MISALKTTILKREMLLEFMSCVCVTFIQKAYENDSFCEITQCQAVTGSPYAMFAYSALKGNTGQKCSTIETAL